MKKITFLRNLITLAIVFVISGLVQAATGTMTITRGSFASGSLTYGVDDLWTATTSQNNTITGYFDIYSTAGQATMQTRTNTPIGSYPYNTVAMPGPITKITLTGGATGTARAWTPYLATTSLTKSNYTSGTSQGTKTAVDNSASTSWDVSSANNFRFFYLNMTGGAAYLSSIVIEYEIESANPTVATPLIEVTNGVAKSTDTYFNFAEVTITSATENASIYYTTNGDAPTTSSTLYEDPFTITSTKTIKALAVKAEMDDSGIADKTITIVVPATATVPYTEAFNNTLGDWYNYEVAGTKPWYASVNGAIANGYGGGDVESWLISPKFTATEDGLALSFNYASKYPGDPILVKVSNDYIGYGSPAAATWTTISTVLAPEVQDDAYTVKSTGNIIHASSGTVYFAFVYDAAAAPYSDWRITNASVTLPPEGPVITVTEAEVPAMSAYVDASDSETITVNGVNLTTDITVALGGTDAAQFRLSTSTLAQTDGAVTDASVTIYYEPTDVGSHTATVTLSSTGAESVVKTLSGEATWAPLDAPVATDASGITQTGFQANWNAVAGATEYELTVYTKEESVVNATDLFISEYIEGSGNNKYIEIFNGTGASVDLSDYKLQLFANGSSTPSNDNLLSGVLGHGEVIVYMNSSATLTLPEGVTPVVSSSTNFNGDDAIAIYKISTESYVDIFGRIGNDPGSAWTADGGYTTVDKTLRRKSSVTGGVTVNPTGTGTAAFTTLGTEWDLYNVDVVADLGSHTFAGEGSSQTEISGSPFTVTDGTSKAITGLTPSTTYYYTIKAANVNVESAVSNEISVVTSFGTSTDNPTLTSIYAHNAKIHFTATAGEKVEVYNAVGQKIISTLATDGQNELPVNAKGVMIVKVGSRLAKVIL